MEELAKQISATMVVVDGNINKFVKDGNKTAGVRARKASLKLEKQLKQFRKESVAVGK